MRDRHGDPARDPAAVLMIERQSYERLIDGLRIAAEALVHLARYETLSDDRAKRKRMAQILDQARGPAIQHAGIEDTLRAGPTEEVRGSVRMPCRAASVRLIDGLKQAKGGARQIRMDLTRRRCGARDR